MKNTLFMWLSCIFILTGCTTNYPKDIAVVSIEMVDQQEQAELPSPLSPTSFESMNPYREYLLALSKEKGEESINTKDMEVYFRKQKANLMFRNSKPQKMLLKVEFSSQENLHMFARSNSYPVAIWPYFCNRPEVRVSLGTEVFWNGLDIGAPLNYEMKKNKGVFVYYTFLNVTFTAEPPSSYESFDLRAHPEDICFNVGGGFSGRGFESNTVLISKAEIIQALK